MDIQYPLGLGVKQFLPLKSPRCTRTPTPPFVFLSGNEGFFIPARATRHSHPDPDVGPSHSADGLTRAPLETRTPPVCSVTRTDSTPATHSSRTPPRTPTRASQAPSHSANSLTRIPLPDPKQYRACTSRDPHPAVCSVIRTDATPAAHRVATLGHLTPHPHPHPYPDDAGGHRLPPRPECNGRRTLPHADSTRLPHPPRTNSTRHGSSRNLRLRRAPCVSGRCTRTHTPADTNSRISPAASLRVAPPPLQARHPHRTDPAMTIAHAPTTPTTPAHRLPPGVKATQRSSHPAPHILDTTSAPVPHKLETMRTPPLHPASAVVAPAHTRPQTQTPAPRRRPLHSESHLHAYIHDTHTRTDPAMTIAHAPTTPTTPAH
ncbi:hypothetical protein K438DRAFT_2026620 [Mycena galopus ATCC 62051]|nr:hypothetical protein K438DRAFT_2026620 [Mycena galopus ATCC 62051]